MSGTRDNRHSSASAPPIKIMTLKIAVAACFNVAVFRKSSIAEKKKAITDILKFVQGFVR